MSMLKVATEEELMQVDEEGRPYKFVMGEKVTLRRITAEEWAQKRREDNYDDLGGLFSPLPRGSESQFSQGQHFVSRNVVTLSDADFDDFIKSKEKALVYFYDGSASCERNERENQFSAAADKSTHFNYGFASVDCMFDRRLCDRQMINPQSLPMLKLYSNGFDLSTICCSSVMSADETLTLMKMTPILLQPRVESGREYLAKAEEKPKKKKLFGKFG